MGSYPGQKNVPGVLVIAAVLVVAAIAVYMIAPRVLSQVKVCADQTLTIENGASSQVSAIVETGKSLEVAVDVVSGGAVDVLLMNSDYMVDWGKYVDGQSQSFAYISQGSALNTKLFRYAFVVPQKDTYFVIVNNRGRIPGGATPIGDVVVRVKMLTR